MDQATQEQLTQLESDLEYLADLDVDHLAARRELGEVNFESGREVFERAKGLAQEWKTFPLSLAPPPAIQQLVSQFQNLRQSIGEVADFKLSGVQNPEQIRDQKLDAVQKHCDSTVDTVFQLRPALAVLSTTFREPLRQARELIEDARGEVENELRLVRENREETEKVLRAAREAAKREGVQNFAPLFEDLATENSNESAWWLKTTALLGAITAITAPLLLVVWKVDGAMTSGAVASMVMSKLVVVSLLYYATIWSARNYRALRHQRTVNQHRHKALMTFQTFAEGGESSDTRDAVLREATRCVFSQGPTGYLGRHEETPQSNVIEVLLNAAKSGGQSS